MESILDSVKKLLGIDPSITDFDTDIIFYINATFSTLSQIVSGLKDGFIITDNTTTWNEYLGDTTNVEFIKTYVYLKVRLIFDPPTSSSLLTAINEQIKELEFRINISEI